MLTIVGGTYHEVCVDPNWNELFGSGFRAAAGLAHRKVPIQFFTYADSEVTRILELLCHQLSVSLTTVNINKTIQFEYQHPLAAPSILPDSSVYTATNTISLDNIESALCYGMLEGNAIINGNRIVYDPQGPGNPKLFTENGSSAKSLIYVLNFSEASHLAQSDDLNTIVQHFTHHVDATAVIIKNGAYGGFVIEKGKNLQFIPVFKTDRVWPIGSGDIFSASFAYFWLIDNEPVFESAIKASLSTANYVDSKSLPINLHPQTGTFEELRIPQDAHDLQIYLAGPFFSIGQRWAISQARDILTRFGFKVFSPLHDVGVGGPKDVVQKDLVGLKKSDLIYAILDGLDSGTLFEIGYAVALNKPVVCLCESEKTEALTMLLGTNCEIETDFSTSIYKAVWKVMSSK